MMAIASVAKTGIRDRYNASRKLGGIISSTEEVVVMDSISVSDFQSEGVVLPQPQPQPQPSQSQSQSRRSLGEPDVGLFVSGGEGMCQIRNSLDTVYSGSTTAFGAVFTVQALTNSLDIQGIEFANIKAGAGSDVKIYVRKDTTFSSNPMDWIELVSTASVPSPDGLGSIAPRADFTRSVALNQGDVWMFYVSLESGNLKMADSSATGSVYQSDEFLQLNVGESVAAGEDFSGARTANQAFQGKLYYRVLKPCNTLGTETEFIFPFAAAAGTDKVALNAAVSAGFEQLLVDEKDLARWVNLYGLNIKTMTLKSIGSEADCAKYGITGGCDLYDSDLIFGHFQSLDPRELVLEFMVKLNIRKGLGTLQDNLNVVYTGDDVFEQQYDLTLTGVPFGTVLNPIQREYLQKVTFDFLDEFSDANPHRVEIRQAVETGRRQLRGGEADGTHRSLQPPAVVRAEAVVYGIGDDKREFLEELEQAFLKNTDQYKAEVQKQQYLPGEINDRGNLGDIFSDLLGISVKRVGSDEPLASTGDGGGGLDSNQIQIIAFSSAIALACLWIIYRILKDCVWVQSGWEVKKERLSDKTELSPTMRPELENMDKPRQNPRPSTVDISALAQLKLAPKEDLSREESSVRRGRKPPSALGVGKAKSSDDLDFFGGSNSSRRPTRAKSDFPPTVPVRGVIRNKSADDDLLFASSTRSSRTTGGSSVRSTRTAGEPTRGVARAKSSDDMDFGTRRQSTAQARPEPASRGVARSKSSDFMGMFGANRQPSADVRARPPPATRGVARSSTFSGVEGFIGNPQSNGVAPAPSAATPTGTKKKKKKGTVDGEASVSSKKKKKAKSNASISTEGSGSKKSKAGCKTKKTKKKSNIENGAPGADQRPPKPPRRVDMAGPASPRGAGPS